MTQIDHPEYYQANGLEAINVIDALGLGPGFALGSAIKYIFRAGKKSGEATQDDVKKAIWYLDHYIQRLKEMEVEHGQEDTKDELLVCKN